MREKIGEFIKSEGIFLPKELLVSLYSQVLKFAGGLSGLIQAGSKEAGRKAGENFKKFLKEVDYKIEEIIEVFFEETGMGRIKVENIENGYKITIIDTFLLNAHSREDVTLKPLVGAIEGFLEAFENKVYNSKLEGRVIILRQK